MSIAILALVVAACGGSSASKSPSASSPAGTTGPTAPAATSGATTGPDATSAPDATKAPFTGDLKSLAEALEPANSTITGHLDSTGVYQIYLTTTASVDDLKSFWGGKVPSLGFKNYSYTELSGTIYAGAENPTLAIIAGPDSATKVMTVIINVSAE
jgi:hypothetical protein